MSDAPSNTNGDTAFPSSALRDGRWIAAIFWGGMLAALLVTSGAAITALVQGGFYSRSFLSPSSSSDLQHQVRVVAVLATIFEAAIALVLLAAWLQFLRATNTLIHAYTLETNEDDAPMVADWVLADGEDRSLRTLAGNVLMYVAIAWAVIIVAPGVLSIAAAYS